MNNTLKINNSVLKDYFEIVGTLPRKEYLDRYNTNISHVGTDGNVRLSTRVNKNNDTIHTWVTDTQREKFIDNFDFNVSVNSNDMSDYLAIFDKDENSELNITKKMSDNKVNGIYIDTDTTTLDLKATDEYDYDYPANEKSKTTIYLDANDFVNGAENVLKCIATNETHMPTICSLSVKVDYENNTLELAGIDGFRINTKKIKVINIFKENDKRDQFLIKKCSVQTMLKMIKKIKTVLKKRVFGNDLTLVFTENTLLCDFNGYFLTAKLQDGTFFEYESIRLKETTLSFKTDRDNLLKELKKLSKVESGRYNASLVKMHISDGYLNLSAKNENVECSINYSSNVKDYQGEELIIAFNTKYLIEAIEKLDRKQEIKLSFNKNINPVQIEYTDKNNNSGLNEVLPVRLEY